MKDFSSQIKARISIVDLVSGYVKLKKMGASYKGLCPFHVEKTPSFVVSPERGIAYCFGCQRGGDVFKFVQEVEGVSFFEAMKMLADRAGLKFEKEKAVIKSKISKDERQSLLEVSEFVAKFYERYLWEEGRIALEYLRNRGVNDETIRKFRIGLAPDSFDRTYKILLQQGFSQEIVVRAGFALAKDTALNQIYDRFRGRLMFPVFDSIGQVVGFGGRTLKTDQEPKYLNSPESVIYQKSNLLYGFNMNKQAIRLKKKVLIVEGYMDLVLAVQAGLHEVVAVLGTALTQRHLSLLRGYVEELVLGFDMDLAGQQAARRSYDLASGMDFKVKILVLDQGKDIADFLLKRSGEDLKKMFSEAKFFNEFLYEQILKNYSGIGFDSKMKVIKELQPVLVKVKSSVERDEIVRRLAVDLDLKESLIYDEIRNLSLSQNHPVKLQEEVGLRPKKWLTSEILLGVFLYKSEIAVKFLDEKINEEWFDSWDKNVYKMLKEYYSLLRTGGCFVLNDFFEVFKFEDQLKENCNLLTLFVEQNYGEMSMEQLEKMVLSLIKRLNFNYMRNKRLSLQVELKKAEQEKNQAKVIELLKLMTELN